jgi:hypothetical protein
MRSVVRTKQNACEALAEREIGELQWQLSSAVLVPVDFSRWTQPDHAPPWRWLAREGLSVTVAKQPLPNAVHVPKATLLLPRAHDPVTFD